MSWGYVRPCCLYMSNRNIPVVNVRGFFFPFHRLHLSNVKIIFQKKELWLLYDKLSDRDLGLVKFEADWLKKGDLS